MLSLPPRTLLKQKTYAFILSVHYAFITLQRISLLSGLKNVQNLGLSGFLGYMDVGFLSEFVCVLRVSGSLAPGFDYQGWHTSNTAASLSTKHELKAPINSSAARAGCTRYPDSSLSFRLFLTFTSLCTQFTHFSIAD